MVEVKKLPPGEAIGARDLQSWASDRMANRSKSWRRISGKTTISLTCRDCGRHRQMQMEKRAAKGAKFKCSGCGSNRVNVSKPKWVRRAKR